ncbi:hypothetical protein D805_1693 [Bifidobacterium thermophilum RBL67]|uniref:Uncharacterized protein n=1 Tax=Bifidobacterium thermophilum RBL67 TaxID=1254439 RepID=M4REM7_9BIFI|nr:hypothetical protein D805_1693 [Bifidobacterium thermophilum RBL67]
MWLGYVPRLSHARHASALHAMASALGQRAHHMTTIADGGC